MDVEEHILRAVGIVQSLAAIALLAIPATALAAPDQHTNGNQNGCGYYNSNHQWVSTNCNGNNGQNGNWNNGRRTGESDDNGDRDDQQDNGRHDNGRHNGWYNHGNGNGYGATRNGNYGNGNYGGGYGGNRGNQQLSGSVSSFSPYNLYLSNGTHVELHDGTIINPTGTNLSPGMRVRVSGNWNNDGTYNANQIDVINGYGR